MEYLYKNIESLQTPVGEFIVTDSEKRIRFSVIKKKCIPPAITLPDNGEILTDTIFSIVINTSILEIGKKYKIMFTTGNWKYCESDEHTDCYYSIINDWAVGIGGFDPNDDEKIRQAIKYSKQIGVYENYHVIEEPEHYDESLFVTYKLDVLDSFNGYEFTLIDRTRDQICFEVAWIKITKYSPDDYEYALAIWLC